jgi:hypothetical protein
MHMILSYETGKRTEGILLAVSPGRMRVVVRERNDTVELSLIGDRWISEDGDHVEIESLIADGETGMAAFYSQVVPQTRTACN